MLFKSFCLIPILVLLAACSPVKLPSLSPTPTPNSEIANPASVYCQQQGGQYRIITAADGSQSGLCIFPDGSSCDEWAYWRGECSPAGQLGTPEPAATLTGTPAARPTLMGEPGPIDPAWYQGWWTYIDPTYGFSLRLPPDWVVEQVTSGDASMNGHMLNLQAQAPGPTNLLLRVSFRQVGEDNLLWPSGVGEGDFVSLGKLAVSAGFASRSILVCPTGQVNEAWYAADAGNGPIHVGSMEFGFVLGYQGIHCQPGYSLGGKDLMTGEMIIASLTMP